MNSHRRNTTAPAQKGRIACVGLGMVLASHQHNGATGGSRSLVAFAPARGAGIVVLANSAVSVDTLGLRLLREANTPAA